MCQSLFAGLNLAHLIIYFGKRLQSNWKGENNSFFDKNGRRQISLFSTFFSGLKPNRRIRWVNHCLKTHNHVGRVRALLLAFCAYSLLTN